LRFLGNIDDKKLAYAQGQTLAKKMGKTVFIEKAKRKEGSHKYTTYRGWLDLDSSSPTVKDLSYPTKKRKR